MRKYIFTEVENMLEYWISEWREDPDTRKLFVMIYSSISYPYR